MILFYGVSLFTGNVLQLFLLPSPWILQSFVWSAIHIQTIDSIFFHLSIFLMVCSILPFPLCNLVCVANQSNNNDKMKQTQRIRKRQKSQQFTVELKYRIFNRFFSRMKSLLPSILFLMKNESGWIEVKYFDVFFIQHWDEFKTETFRYKLQSRSCVCRMITFFFLTVRKVLVIQTKRKSFAKLFWWLCKNIQLADFNLFRVNNTINKFDHQNRMTSSCDTFDRLKMNVKMTV